MAASKAMIVKTKRNTVDFMFNGKAVRVPVSEELKARFDEQFFRANPTDEQDKRLQTLFSLMRAAYELGLNSD